MAPKTLTSFQEIESEWMGMLSSSPVNTLFLSPQWQQVWWENFGDGKTMAGFYVPSSNGVDAIASLTSTGNTLAFLGSQETVDYNDFMVRRGFEASFFEVLLGQLEDRSWEVMQLDSLVETSPTLQHLPDMARRPGILGGGATGRHSLRHPVAGDVGRLPGSPFQEKPTRTPPEIQAAGSSTGLALVCRYRP